MPNPRTIQEFNAIKLAEKIMSSPNIAKIFNHQNISDDCDEFDRQRLPIIKEIQESRSSVREICLYEESIFKFVKISPPSFLKEDQKDFFMSKFPLKDKNE